MEKKRTYGVWAVRSSTSIFGPAQSWCKENGKPLEFDTKAAAENYAKEANEHTTANVRYYVKEKEPEPGAVRKGTSQPELDARSHEEVIPRNDAAEKQNEIPGRQIPSQTDPLVEIRSAVHSNYAGTLREREVYLEGSHENKVWRFYQEQTNDPVLAYAISLKEVRDGKIFGDLYPLNYREHVERMKKLTCPIGNVAVAFEDGNVITIPYQERRQFMNRLMPEHGAPKTMTYLPENEPELMIILKRERLKRSYHATAGNLEEYLDKLEKTTLREKLKRAKTAVSTQEVSSHKRGLER
jgi:hypothetical protein